MTAGAWLALAAIVLLIATAVVAFYYLRGMDWKSAALRERARADAEAEDEAREGDLDKARELDDHAALEELQKNAGKNQ